jgi:hypothetical protein
LVIRMLMLCENDQLRSLGREKSSYKEARLLEEDDDDDNNNDKLLPLLTAVSYLEGCVLGIRQNYEQDLDHLGWKFPTMTK